MSEYLPGLEPDFDVKQQLRFVGGMPDLHQFDMVFISCSGGKDSHSMAYLLAELAHRQNYDKAKMELIYADTGLEWHDTFDQVQRIGTALGIKSVKVLPKYTLLDNVRRRWAKFNGLPEDWHTAKSVDIRTGQDRTGQDRTGQDRTGQDRTGQDRTGQDRNPFPTSTIRYCTGEGKHNAIKDLIRIRTPVVTDHFHRSLPGSAHRGESKNLSISTSSSKEGD